MLRLCNKAVACAVQAVSIYMEPYKADNTAQSQQKNPTNHRTTKKLLSLAC